LAFGSWILVPGILLALSFETGQRRHDLIRDGLHHFLQIGTFRGLWIAVLFFSIKSMRLRNEFAVAAVKDAVAAEVAVFAAEARVVVTEPLLDVEQLLRLPLGEIIHASKLAGENEDATIGVDNLAVEIGVFQVRAESRCAVIGQDDRVAILYVGDNRFGESLRAGRLIAGHRHFAKEDLHFGENTLGNRLLGNRESSRMRRMTMNYRVDIGASFVDSQMQQHFARALPDSGKLL